MYLFTEELLAIDEIRSELDGAVEIEAICALANAFLGCTPPAVVKTALYDEALRNALVHAPTRLRAEISERLAHVEEGPARTVYSLARDREAAVAVPVLRYSPLLDTRDLVDLVKRRTAETGFEDHLAALAARQGVAPELTVLLASGGTPRVMRVLAANPAARWWWRARTRLALRSPRAALVQPPSLHARGPREEADFRQYSRRNGSSPHRESLRAGGLG
jgi:uncharacterized protein (DUF2336 family)